MVPQLCTAVVYCLHEKWLILSSYDKHGSRSVVNQCSTLCLIGGKLIFVVLAHTIQPSCHVLRSLFGVSLLDMSHVFCVTEGADAAEAGSLESIFPTDYARSSAQYSGKMRCLEVLLSNILSQQDPDKVVIVSNSTAALDIIQTVCDQQRYTAVRIDGATDVNKRQDIVNSFNLYGSAQVILCKHMCIYLTLILCACFNPCHDRYSQVCVRYSAIEVLSIPSCPCTYMDA